MSWLNFNYDQHGKSGFGNADLAYAQGQGYTNAQIRILAQRAMQQGRTVGSKMRNWISTNTEQGPWNYAGVGGGEFGKADLTKALSMGSNYDDITKYTDYATENKIGVGQPVSDWLTENKDNYAYMSINKRREVDKKEMLESQLAAEKRAQEQWTENAAEQKRLNPSRKSSGAGIQAGSAGGVRLNRSEDWKKSGSGGANRGTKQNSRGMLIGGLNI